MASHVRTRKSKTSSKSRKSRKSVSPARRKCNLLLSRKIQTNIDEYLSGKKFYSPKQPIAVSYAFIRKTYPKCSRYYKRYVKKMSKRRSRL